MVVLGSLGVPTTELVKLVVVVTEEVVTVHLVTGCPPAPTACVVEVEVTVETTVVAKKRHFAVDLL